MVILGIDLGEARTGLALCDKDEILAYPLCTIEESNVKILAQKISIKINENRTELVVLGYPLNMNGTIGDRAKKIKDFEKILYEISGSKIVLWDERLTTLSAKKNFIYIKRKSKKCKKIIDVAASCLILQNYLEFRKSTSQL